MVLAFAGDSTMTSDFPEFCDFRATVRTFTFLKRLQRLARRTALFYRHRGPHTPSADYSPQLWQGCGFSETRRPCQTDEALTPAPTLDINSECPIFVRWQEVNP